MTKTMNKLRELFLLFPYFGQKVEGYTIIHKNTFPNDEPPYIMVSFWGITSNYDLSKPIYEEDGESRDFYLIRDKDAKKFIHLMNSSQKDYCDYYLEGVYTRNAGEHNLKPDEYAQGGYTRPPKVKYMHVEPNPTSFQTTL
jgi:hypothetical protein